MLKKVLPVTLSLLVTMTAWSPALLASANKEASTTPAASTNMQFGNTGMTAVEVKNLHHSGKLLVKKIKVTDSTLVNGFLEAVDSNFNKDTIVNGNIDAKSSSFNDLTINGGVKFKDVSTAGKAVINGKVELDHSKFDNTLNVNGHLSAKDSNFAKMVTMKSTDAEFENCNLQDITVQKSSTDPVQTIKLKGTKVSGNITFESGKGVVEQDATSTIEGKVKGGTVQK